MTRGMSYLKRLPPAGQAAALAHMWPLKPLCLAEVRLGKIAHELYQV